MSTVLAIADELTQDGLVLRYKVEGTDTGFDGEEGTLIGAVSLLIESDRKGSATLVI